MKNSKQQVKLNKNQDKSLQNKVQLVSHQNYAPNLFYVQNMSNYALWKHIRANRMITIKSISKQLNKFHKNSSLNRTHSMSIISNFMLFGQEEVWKLNSLSQVMLIQVQTRHNFMYQL